MIGHPTLCREAQSDGMVQHKLEIQRVIVDVDKKPHSKGQILLPLYFSAINMSYM